jgi:hypothetical protein
MSALPNRNWRGRSLCLVVLIAGAAMAGPNMNFSDQQLRDGLMVPEDRYLDLGATLVGSYRDLEYTPSVPVWAQDEGTGRTFHLWAGAPTTAR